MQTASEIWAAFDAANVARWTRAAERHWSMGERAMSRGDQEYALRCFKRSMRWENRADEIERRQWQ